MNSRLIASACALSVALAACGSEQDGQAEAAPAAELASADAAAPNTLTEAEKAEGWALLFDGSSLQGWRGLGMDSIPTAHWTVENGTIKKIASGNVPVAADGQPTAGGDLMTEQTFGDYEMTFEWKITEGANSGVKYNVSEDMSTANPPRSAALGFEYQILDDERHPDANAGVNGNRQAAGLYDLIAPDRAAKQVRPVGEWNEGRIVFRGNHGEHWLNGQKVLEYDLGTPRMDSLVAASKYATIPGFADRRTGHIVLQDHNDEVYYRNIKVRDLQ